MQCCHKRMIVRICPIYAEACKQRIVGHCKMVSTCRDSNSRLSAMSTLRRRDKLCSRNDNSPCYRLFLVGMLDTRGLLILVVRRDKIRSFLTMG